MYLSFYAESFNSTSGPSADPDGVTLGPYPQPSQAIIDQDQEEQAPISHVQDQEQQATTGQDQDQHTLNDQDQDQHTAAICLDREQVSKYPKTLSDTVVISSHELKPDSPEKSLPDEKGTEGEAICLSI